MQHRPKHWLLTSRPIQNRLLMVQTLEHPQLSVGYQSLLNYNQIVHPVTQQLTKKLVVVKTLNKMRSKIMPIVSFAVKMLTILALMISNHILNNLTNKQIKKICLKANNLTLLMALDYSVKVALSVLVVARPGLEGNLVRKVWILHLQVSNENCLNWPIKSRSLKEMMVAKRTTLFKKINAMIFWVSLNRVVVISIRVSDPASHCRKMIILHPNKKSQ